MTAAGSRGVTYHERAQELPRATPEDVELAPVDLSTPPVIRLHDVSKTFLRGEELHAVVGIDLDLHPGETLGLVGESGSGKTTLARVLLGFTRARRGLGHRARD